MDTLKATSEVVDGTSSYPTVLWTCIYSLCVHEHTCVCTHPETLFQCTFSSSPAQGPCGWLPHRTTNLLKALPSHVLNSPQFLLTAPSTAPCLPHTPARSWSCWPYKQRWPHWRPARLLGELHLGLMAISYYRNCLPGESIPGPDNRIKVHHQSR